MSSGCVYTEGITHIFFHPDYTVGTGVTPVQLSHADFTADREFHPALKTFLFRFLYYNRKCVICNCFFLWYNKANLFEALSSNWTDVLKGGSWLALPGHFKTMHAAAAGRTCDITPDDLVFVNQ